MPDKAPRLQDLQRITDERSLLPREDPSSTYVDDAIHWCRVYAELISVKIAMLERAELAAVGLSQDAVDDIGVDQELLRAQLNRYKARLAYWTERLDELSGATGPGPAQYWPIAHDEDRASHSNGNRADG